MISMSLKSIYRCALFSFFNWGLLAQTLPPALLTALPAGYKQTVMTAASQSCTGNANGAKTCTATGGDTALVFRAGVSLDRAGNAYVAASGTTTFTINMIDEHGGDGPATIGPFAEITTKLTACSINGTQASKTGQYIASFGFNPPLNVLDIVTANVRYRYENLIAVPGLGFSFPVPCPDGISNQGMNVAAGTFTGDITYALVRITGPFPETVKGKKN